jgi:hypothetical protein
MFYLVSFIIGNLIAFVLLKLVIEKDIYYNEKVGIMQKTYFAISVLLIGSILLPLILIIIFYIAKTKYYERHNRFR